MAGAVLGGTCICMKSGAQSGQAWRGKHCAPMTIHFNNIFLILLSCRFKLLKLVVQNVIPTKPFREIKKLTGMNMLIDNKNILEIINDPFHAEIFNEIINAPFNQGFTVKDDKYKFGFSTHPGLVRKRNEDRLALCIVNFTNKEYYFCAILCDGVGGTEFGDIAASIAISSILTKLSKNHSKTPLKEQLTTIIQETDNLIRKILSGRGSTTLSLFLASSTGDIISINIGDSRVFSWQPITKQLKQVSIDDTLENELAHLKLKDASALREMKLGGTLSQALGEKNRSEYDLNFNFYHKENFPEGVILASDGAWKESESAFKKIIINSPNHEVARRVVVSSTWLGGGDNTSIITIPSLITLQQEIESSRLSVYSNTLSLWCGDFKAKFISPVTVPSNEAKKANYKKSNKKITTPTTKKNINEKNLNIQEEIIIEEFNLDNKHKNDH
ncbi:hypothetical protein CTZ24_17445 [Pantoea phytobeneficialis]|nr:hypothetical protein CTZ24_17445 [Pantoea phytobeneficialis]